MSEQYKRYFLDITDWELYKSSQQYQECMLRFSNSKERETVEVIELQALTDLQAKYDKLVIAAEHYSKFLEQNGYENTALHKALAEIEGE